VGAHEAFRLAYYGALLSNPAYAKVSPSLPAAVRGLGYLARYAVLEGVPFLIPVAAAALVRAPLPASRVVAAAVALYLAFVVSVGGDGLYAHRFLAHVAPLLAVLGAVGLVPIWGILSAWMAGQAVTARLAIVLAAAALFVPRTGGSFHAGARIDHFRRSEDRWAEIGATLARTAPPETLVATNVAGKLPYHARRRTLDLLGLCDPVIARTRVDDEGTGYAGHERANPGYVLGRSPDVIYLSVLDGVPPTRTMGLAAAAEELRTTPLRRYAALFEADGFGERYRPALLQLGSGERALVYVRPAGPVGRMPREALTVLEWSAPGVDDAGSARRGGVRPQTPFGPGVPLSSSPR
jgi:hypothetical protein